MNLKKSSNQRLTRSGQLEIYKVVLEFCLMEVQRTEYDFSSLESYIISLAKRKILSSFNLANEKEIVDILKVRFEQNDHISAIELKMKDTFPISTQEVMLPEGELQPKNQKNTKKSKMKIK